jgi:Recombination endonuclease VII
MTKEEAAAKAREWRKKNPDKAAAIKQRFKEKNGERYKEYFRKRAREWYRDHKEKAQEYGRKYYVERGKALRTPEKRFKEALKRNYGLTLEQYNEMLAATGGFCPVCSDPLEGRNIHVDHCHRTGRVRGILCVKCNTSEGFLRTSANAFKLYEYMKLHEGQL